MVQKNKLPNGWQEVKFLDCLQKEASNNQLKIQQKDFLEEGKYPIIDQGEEFVAGYTNDKSKVYSGKLPVVVFGDHTRILKFVNFPFALGADGVKILVPKNGLNEKYFYYALRKINISSAGYSRHYKFLKAQRVIVPPLSVQKSIVAILEKAERLKQKREDADKLTKEYLQSVFYEMFYKKNNEVKGFLDVFDITTGKLDSNALEENGKYPFFTCSQETYRINNFAFDCEALLLAGNNAAGIYSVKYYNGKFNAYQITYVLTLKNKGHFKYFHFVLTNKLKELQRASIGTNTKYLTLGILKNIEIPIPHLPLQQKFASIVEKVEKLKETQKESKTEISILFDSLMQKAFKGELVR